MATLLTALEGRVVLTTNTAPVMGNVNRYNATAGSLSITLPALSGLNVGSRTFVQKYAGDASANTVTFSRAGSDQFDDGSTSLTLDTPGESRTLQVVQISGVKRWKITEEMKSFDSLDTTTLIIPTSGAPSNAVGLNGDQALDRATGTVYAKSGGAWDAGTKLKLSLIVAFPATGSTLAAGTLNIFGGGSPGTYNLPPVAATAGVLIVIKNQSSATLTVDPSGVEVINDETGTSASTIALAPNTAVTLSSDGFDWQLTSGTTRVAVATHAATSKTTPVDADELPLVDSAASNVLKKLTWANLKATVRPLGVVIRSTSGGLVAGNFTVFSGSTASQTLSLPTAGSSKGERITMKNIASVSVTIDVSGGGSIFAGASSASSVTVASGASFDAVSDEFEWLVI